jgi:three-Cys-motif partner protein
MLMTTNFGGEHTERKLAVISDYLSSYCRALKNQAFEIAYVDAFAGSGFRRVKIEDELSLFDGATDWSVHTGSALRALDVDPGFDRFFFIESDASSFAELGKHVQAHRKAGQARLFHEDANAALARIVESVNWRSNRAVLFLDPFGMQVEWQTLARVAETGSIDLWYLCPIGLGFNRLLARNAEIPEGWRRRLTTSLGTSDWEQAFYTSTPQQSDLLGAKPQVVARAAELEDIERYFVRRLQTVFRGGVLDQALRLGLPGKAPMYSLMFACGNPARSASSLAFRLARAALKKGLVRGRP